MKFFNSFLIASFVFVLLGCSSSPQSKNQSQKSDQNLSQLHDWQSEISQLNPVFCHMGMMDLQEKVQQENIAKSSLSAEDYFLLRMELRQKMNNWVQKDAQLSVECQKMAFRVQSAWKTIEENLLVTRAPKLPEGDQLVFTNSQWQLFSNPFLLDSGMVTSVSELQNGDVVLSDVKISVIAKNENGEMQSWITDSTGHWVQRSLHHPLSWLKQPVKRVVVLRHWDTGKRTQLVNWVQSQYGSKERKPSSEWLEDFEANAHFLQVFEWRNHSLIGK